MLEFDDVGPSVVEESLLESGLDGLLAGGGLGEAVCYLLLGGDPGEGGDLAPVDDLLHPADVLDDHRRLAGVLGGED